MKLRRWLLAGLGGALVTVLTVGVALAGPRSDPAASAQDSPSDPERMTAACKAMHDSPAMKDFREQLPAEAREQMDKLHAQMRSMLHDMDECDECGMGECDMDDMPEMMRGMKGMSSMMDAMR